MRRLAALLLLAASCGTPAYAQPRTFRDSVRAALLQPDTVVRTDTLVRVRVDTLVRTDTLLRVRVDTLIRLRVDTVVRRDTVIVRDTLPSPPPPPPPPPVPIDTTRLGASDALGKRYLSDFVTAYDKLWTTEGSVWGANYYDKVWVYYQAAARPEFAARSAEYRARGAEIAIAYRTDYLEKNAYGSSAHWSQLEGIAEHFRQTRDSASRTAVLRTADKLAGAYMKSPYSYLTPANGEGRIWQRTAIAQLLAWELSATAIDSARYARRLDSLVTHAVKWQAADGSFPYLGQACGGTLPYMEGLRASTLLDMHDRYRPDPRILPMVGKSLAYLWTQWRPDASFHYLTVTCANGGPTPSPDLNQLFAYAFARYAQITGDATMRARAEAIFAGGVGRGFLSGSKQAAENYVLGFRFLELR